MANVDSGSSNSRSLVEKLQTWVQLFAAIVSLIGSGYAVYKSIAAHDTAQESKLQSDAAKQKSIENKSDLSALKSTVLDAESQKSVKSASYNNASPFPEIKSESLPTADAQNDFYIVQLASYLKSDCAIADAEAQGYKGVLTPPPTLWRVPGGGIFVVASKVPTRQEAEDLLNKARDLANDPRFKMNDLKDATIRKNPSWTITSACPG